MLNWIASGLGAAMALASPPIFQPGAPGEETRRLTPEESVALGQSRYTAADVRFMQHMIVHHSQAVEMNALIADRSTHEGVRLMGARIAASQISEIGMMRTWLERRGESPEMSDMSGMDHSAMADIADEPHAGHDMPPSETPLMAGMLSPAQMARLADAEGDAFDRLFLTGMIHHHQGAIDMVEALRAEPGAGEDPELSQFLSDIVADQSAEIARMRALLAGL